MKRRLVIELYGHTSVSEVADILEDLKRIGLDDIKYECDDERLRKTTIEHLRTVFNVEVQ